MKLHSWSLHPVGLPYVRKIAWSGSEDTFAPLLILRLVGEDGHVGAAEVAVKPTWFGESYRSITAVLEDVLLPLAQKLDVLDENAFWLAAPRIPENSAAKGLIDTALWDLRAAVDGRPLWRRWGGDNKARVCWMLTRQAPELMAREMDEVFLRHGFKAIKLKGGQGVDTDIRAIREVRAVVGDAVQIFVDTNSHYQESEAVDYLARLADEGVVAVEDPYALAPNAGFEAVQRKAALPIIVDVAAWSVRDTQLFCERGAKALAIKAGRSGLSAAWEQARIAERAKCKAHVGFSGESAFGSLSSLQFAASLPGREQWLPSEISYFMMMAEHPLSEPIKVVDGTIELSEAPSCASRVDWDKVKRLSI